MKNESSIAVATREILSLNNEGIEFITRGNFTRAISVFFCGIKKAKQIILLSEIVDNDARPPPAATPPACAFFKIIQDDSSISSTQQFFTRGNQESHPLVFNRPLSVPASSTFCAKNNDAIPSNILKLAFIQIYNLALSLHLSALAQARMSTTDGGNKNKELLNKKLHKVLALYECAEEMGDALQLSLIERMALVNNLGHVNSALKNDMHSQGCFQNLMRLLNLLKEETSNKDHQMSINEQKLYEGFLDNALSFFLFPRDSLPAAAA